MSTATISIEVDADAARAYAASSPQERRKLELLLNLRLRELVSAPPRPLREVMDEIGQQAEALGLTQEKLDCLLNEQ